MHIFDCLEDHTTKKEKKNSSHKTSQTSAQSELDVISITIEYHFGNKTVN